jgi:hypothetical protein
MEPQLNIPSRKRDYDYFGQFYDAGRQWASEQIDTLVQLYFGKNRNLSEFEQQAESAFQKLGLSSCLPTEPPSHSRYRSDAELAKRRFTSGVLDMVGEKVRQRSITKR